MTRDEFLLSAEQQQIAEEMWLEDDEPSWINPDEEITGNSRIDWANFADIVKERASDPVNSPSHYMKGQFEVIEIIEECVPDPYSYYMGNAIKYLLRHQDKGKPKQDLEKCKWYLDKMIEDWRNN